MEGVNHRQYLRGNLEMCTIKVSVELMATTGYTPSVGRRGQNRKRGQVE